VLAFGDVFFELRVIGFQRALSKFIVVVQEVATCTDLVCAVPVGSDMIRPVREDVRPADFKPKHEPYW
jgi:hypothetical protein